MTCKECGATVASTDRWCPACRAPNLGCRFHPRFGPEPRRTEPQILIDLAPPGSPACPRCERVIRPGTPFCAGCGMDLAGAWARHRHQQAVEAWRRREGPGRPYRPAGPLGTLTRASSASVALVAAVVAVGLLVPAAAGPDLVTDLIATYLPGLWWSLGALALLTVILAVGLGRRLLGNLPALAVVDRRVRPSGLELIRPRKVLDDLWRTSDPALAPCSPAWRRGPVPAASTTWVAALLTAGATGFAGAAAPGSADLLFGLAASGVLVASVSLGRLLGQIGGRQDRRYAAVASDVAVEPTRPPVPRPAPAITDVSGPAVVVLDASTGPWSQAPGRRPAAPADRSGGPRARRPVWHRG